MSNESKAIKRKFSKINGPDGTFHRTGPSQASLCTKCAELRLEEALINIKPPVKAETWMRLDVKIANVGKYYRNQWAKDCNLCYMLSASRVTVNRPQDDVGRDELHVFELHDDLSQINDESRGLELLRGNSSLYLAVVPSNYIGFSYSDLKVNGERNGFTAIHRRDTPKPQIYTPRIVSPLFDLSLARHWVQYCKDHHKRLCSLKNKATLELHLIDCRSLEVIPAPDQAVYTALSYVWGAPTATTELLESTVSFGSHGRRLPSPMPAIVADAISVTIGSGFHFLWVDRYCIDQDSHSKHQQINQMDSIYQNAEMTIIAAAGNGPEYGLPGINSRLRCGSRAFTAGNFDIIPTMTHPHRTIQSSKWSSRGWTFQEAALSRRNLVFTEDQVYFECNAMNCHESLESDLDKLHVKDKSKFREVLQNGLFGRNEKQKYGCFDASTLKPAANLVRFMGMVEQYTARDLTYDTDSLNAFTGIIRNLETSQTAVNQIWGVPFCRCESEKQTERSFVDGLGWNHKATIRHNHGNPRRRPEFPSWSWAGWAGEIQYEERSISGNMRQLDSEVESVSVETGGKSKVSISAYSDGATIEPWETVSPPVIHIQALVLPASAVTYDTSSLQVFNYPARLALSTGPWDSWGFYQSLQNTDHRRCIYLGHVIDMVAIMVLEAHDDSWSRVGMIFLDEVLFYQFQTSWKEFKTNSKLKGRKGRVYYSRDIGEQGVSFRVR